MQSRPFFDWKTKNKGTEKAVTKYNNWKKCQKVIAQVLRRRRRRKSLCCSEQMKSYENILYVIVRNV